jgi:hypothetical protein
VVYDEVVNESIVFLSAKKNLNFMTLLHVNIIYIFVIVLIIIVVFTYNNKIQ